MKLSACDRFSDLSPDEIHRTQRRIAAAFGDAFAAALADGDFGADDPMELHDATGGAIGETLLPPRPEVVLPQPRPR
ncbi:hypothetical protein [Planctellipticum variicoloris]|uniref:hypothetical protein n=1 Tax=Planctellipticum variicoloris TaxID=3064265 RepID=UPI002C8A231D|nr:hypothetical protein SH412_001250 [Planctomycetaceae bacterium SH412]HTN04069.1 hypothetical protein [Planctomycetaceae bacterium]